MKSNRLSALLSIDHPIIQAGMVWCSGWELASACSNAGILGTIGSGSMYPDQLDQAIQACKKATDRPFAVNIPLMYPQVEDHIATVIRHRVPVVITSAGNPMKYTARLRGEGIKVLHVVSNSKFALKAQAAGVDAVIGEGFEAGGHNGRDETTTLCLIPMLRQTIDIPLVAAGGIATGSAMAAMLALGAEGVQVGSRFVASHESSAHDHFKQAVIEAKEGDTLLTLKELTPVRLLNNPFFQEVVKAYERSASVEELKQLLGRGRAKKGMSEGNLEEGELEIGQISSIISDSKSAGAIIAELLSECNQTLRRLGQIEL